MANVKPVLSWREHAAIQHFDHALTQITAALNSAHTKLRALQRPGEKFSHRVQWCITALNVVVAAVSILKQDLEHKAWEQL